MSRSTFLGGGAGGRGGILPRRHKKPPIWRCGWQCAPVEKFTGRIDPGLYAAHIKFTDTHIENGHFLCVYAQAGEEITILRSIQLGLTKIRLAWNF